MISVADRCESYPYIDPIASQERYDLGNIAFQSSFFDGWYSNFTPSSENSKTWQPSDIVLVSTPTTPTADQDNADRSSSYKLTDGQCGSACALFHELMSYQAGVRSVVVGGQPSAGPMQAASGSRGAIQYSGDALDADFQQTNNITGNATIDVLPRLDAAGYRDTGVWTSYTGFTLRDQVRGDDAANATPLQFSYLAADCRREYTLPCRPTCFLGDDPSSRASACLSSHYPSHSILHPRKRLQHVPALA